MNRIQLALFFLVSSFSIQAFAAAPQSKNFYVSPKGNDANSGVADKPFATLNAARSAVRKAAAKGVPEGGITVWVDDGLYLLGEGFSLGKEDSGQPGRPIAYRAMPGAHPRLFGGVRLAASDFKTVGDAATVARMRPEARGHVVAIRLADGEGPARYPDLFLGNGGMVQLLVDDKIQPLSRWPDVGYTTMASVVDSGIAPQPHGGTFHYRQEVASHAQAWAEAAKRGDLWLTGFWRVPFEIYSMRVADVNTSAQTISFATKSLGGGATSGIGSKYSDTVNGTRIGNGKEQYYVSNLLEEVDRPGKWSYEFRTHTLYFWPPAGDLAKHEVLLANLTTPVVLLSGAQDVQLVGLTVEGGLTQGVTVENGKRELVAGVTVRNTGAGGIDVEGGESNVIQSNDLYDLGSYGIHLVSGDRKTLTAGLDVAENNHIYQFGKQERITEGIFLDGVGNRASHNLVHDGPYNGIRFQGNDQRMEYNEIHHIGLDAGDMGVFYTNGDWAAQGDVIAYNFGHHSPNANGAYLDDGSSGRTVIGNVFYKISSGLFLGGGHNNVFENNLIVDCKTAIHIDDRGVARHYDGTAHHLTNFLKTINPNVAPWSTRYPGFLSGILADPTHPTGNVVKDNGIVAAKIDFQTSAPAVVDPAANPVFSELPFASEAKLDFVLPASNALYQALPSFKPIPFGRIGLQLDAYRTSLPTDAETGRNTDREGIPFFDSNTDVKASDKIAKP